MGGTGGGGGVSGGSGILGVLVGIGVSVAVGPGVKVGLGVLVGVGTGVGALAINEVSGQPRQPNVLPKINPAIRITNRDLFIILRYFHSPLKGICGPYYTTLYGKYKDLERGYFPSAIALDLSFRPFWCMIRLPTDSKHRKARKVERYESTLD